MYLEFYGLKESPFSLTPDPAFLYYSRVHKRAMAFLKYGLQESKGFIQLTGNVGSGKTTLLRAILADLDESSRTAYIINPRAPFPDLLRSIMKDLEIPNVPQTRVKIELLDFFREYLLVQARRNNPVIVIFDEAQNLSVKNLEEIRMLSNFETSKSKLLQIVFVGQPELIETLERPDLRQLKQRIQVRYHLAPLSPADVGEYINHRIKVAGSDGTIKFDAEACRAIYEFSGGIPRLINSVCDIALLIGYVSECRDFGPAQIEEAVMELGGSFSEEPAPEDEAAPPPVAGDVPSEKISLDGPGGVEASDLDVSGSTLTEPIEIEVEIERSSFPEGGSNTILFSVVPADSGDSRGSAAIVEPEISAGPEISAEPAEGLPDSVEAPACVAEIPEVAVPEKEIHSEVAGEERDMRPVRQAEPAIEKAPAASEPRRGENGFLHSILRRSETRRFRVAGIGVSAVTERGTSLFEGLRKFMDRRGNFGKSANGVSGHADGKKITVVMADGQEILGRVRNLSIGGEGFFLFPAKSRNGRMKRYISFKHTLALYFLHEYRAGEKYFPAEDEMARDRRITVTLLNGEVIEGFASGGFDSACARFFVVSASEDKAVWALVERAGVAGIKAKGFKDGIFAEKPLSLLDIPETFIPAEEAVCSYESQGDVEFSAGDFDDALVEYLKAEECGGDRERLEIKMSIGRFNLGLHHLKSNMYQEAAEEFLRVTACPSLVAKARAKVRMIERMIGT